MIAPDTCTCGTPKITVKKGDGPTCAECHMYLYKSVDVCEQCKNVFFTSDMTWVDPVHEVLDNQRYYRIDSVDEKGNYYICRECVKTRKLTVIEYCECSQPKHVSKSLSCSTCNKNIKTMGHFDLFFRKEPNNRVYEHHLYVCDHCHEGVLYNECYQIGRDRTVIGDKLVEYNKKGMTCVCFNCHEKEEYRVIPTYIHCDLCHAQKERSADDHSDFYGYELDSHVSDIPANYVDNPDIYTDMPEDGFCISCGFLSNHDFTLFMFPKKACPEIKNGMNLCNTCVQKLLDTVVYKRINV